MNTLQAFMMGEINRGNERMVFDWDKAARLIKEKKPEFAEAGLAGDWEWTGGTIYEDGEIVTESYTFLASTWATPQLDLDGHIIDCFVMESKTKWDEHTKWPRSAVKILEGRNE